MQQRVFRSILAVVLILAAAGCSGLRGRRAKQEPPAPQVSLSQVPEPARATIERLTAGGTIQQIEKAQEGGRTVYDVEATLRDRDVEYDVAADGTVLTSGQTVPFDSLPIVIRAAAREYFGLEPVRKAFVEVEEGKTFYEIEARKGGKVVTVKLTDTGQIVEEENQ